MAPVIQAVDSGQFASVFYNLLIERGRFQGFFQVVAIHDLSDVVQVSAQSVGSDSGIRFLKFLMKQKQLFQKGAFHVQAGDGCWGVRKRSSLKKVTKETSNSSDREGLTKRSTANFNQDSRADIIRWF